MAITLSDLLTDRQVKLSMRSRTPENAIRELAALLPPDEHLSDPKKFADQAIERERANPSEVEYGVAFPHARTDAVDKIVLMIGRTRAGIPFGRTPTRANLIFLIGVPQRLVSDYLICVGALARIARNDRVRADLLQAGSPEDLVQILATASSPEGGI